MDERIERDELKKEIPAPIAEESIAEAVENSPEAEAEIQPENTPAEDEAAPEALQENAAQDDAEAPAEKAGGSSGAAIEKVVLECISDKTGYPTDMIDVGMELETDLGIDSIKRVEIFSAVFSALDCSLTPDEVGELSGLSDIQSIVAYLTEKI